MGAILSSQIAGHFRNLASYGDHGQYIDLSRMFPAFVIAAICALAGVAMMLILQHKKQR